MTTGDHPIERARLYWGHIPVRLMFSYGKVNKFPFLIVQLWSGNLYGLGEVLVPPNAFLDRLLESLVGAEARGLDALLPETSNDHNRILCEAVSIALYDLVGKASKLPLYALLGAPKSTRVPLMPCLFPVTSTQARDEAEKWLKDGFRYLKVKLTGDLQEDLERVRSIRSVAPESVVLQGDANCGYKTVAAASRAVAELGAAGLNIFEDPLDGDVDAYAELCSRRKDGDAKVMVDALARRSADLSSVLRKGAANMVGIHPDQPGSLGRALTHTRLAQSMGVPVVIGGTGFTGISSAAYQHLTAVATPGGPCGELGGHFDHGMPCSMVKEPLPMKDGYVELPDRPGLGVELNETTLARFAEGTKEW